MMGPGGQQKPHAPVARPPLKAVVWSVLGAGIGIWAIAVLGETFLGALGVPFIIGAFGASAVLLFGAPSSPLAQPYNVMVGHVISALIGVTAYQVVGEVNALAMALAVALAIGAMQLSRSLHPPGGATALIAVIGGEPIHALGYMYVVEPVALGSFVLVGTAFVANNARRGVRWPSFWVPVTRRTGGIAPPLARPLEEQTQEG